MGEIFNKIPPHVLEAICRAPGSIRDGQSGTDINKYLNECKIDNPTPDITKWKRMVNALDQKQHYAGNSNDILKFIQLSIHPSRFLPFGSDYFAEVVTSVNQPLSFIGLGYRTDGKFRNIVPSKTIDDAQKRANTLLQKLEQREVHSDIYKYCKAELLVDNYFMLHSNSNKGKYVGVNARRGYNRKAYCRSDLF